ncbi:MAG: UDP-glucose 4-epimerase GalE [Candidatus Eisenbacteria bacterium]|nr:UDP-glucose 4-epimerase GalE [Candidatus Eisenbacteria bacterium]
MPSSVLVTGGAGYIGSVTVELLAGSGRRVVVLDDLSKGHREAIPADVPLVVGSAGDSELVSTLLREHEVDSVIHFAAKSLVGESMEKPGDYYEANVVHGARLLEAMEAAGVRKIVFSSSAGVYGEPESVPIGETHRTEPVNVYGDTKLAFEKILRWRAGASDLGFVSLRYFNAAGATERCGEDHDPETHLIPIALKVAQGKLPKLTVFGDDYETPDGTCIRDYIDVRDLANAHILALDALDSGRSGVYNLGNGEGWSVLNVIDTVERVTGKTLPREMGERREGDPAKLVASSALAESELGWKATHPELADMVEAAWSWLVDHPEGYAA